MSSFGPFEDSEGHPCHFDGSRMRLPDAKKVKGIRVDLLTSIATVCRSVVNHSPDFVVGYGQGGLVSCCLSKPLVIELVLQMRNVQREEAHQIAQAWNRIKAVWGVEPRFGRTKPDLALLSRVCPEYFKHFPVSGPKLFAVVPRVTAGKEAMVEELRKMEIPVTEQVSDAPMAALYAESVSQLIFWHEGVCQCGKRTYLFSRCPSCIQKEAAEDLESTLEQHGEPEDAEVSTEVLAISELNTGSVVQWVTPDRLRGWAGKGDGTKWVPLPPNIGQLWGVTWKRGRELVLPFAPQGEDHAAGWFVRASGLVGVLFQSGPIKGTKLLEGGKLPWMNGSAVDWSVHRAALDEFCEVVQSRGHLDFRIPGDVEGLMASHLFALLGDVTTAACAPRKEPENRLSVLVRFKKNDRGHWEPAGQNEGGCQVVVYHSPEQQIHVLLLASRKWILTDWAPIKLGSKVGMVQEGEDAWMDREGHAEDIRVDASMGEFEVTGSLRAAWYSAQKADANLRTRLQKCPNGYRIAPDGVLEKLADQGVKEHWVPVVPVGEAFAGISWRRACFNQCHGSLLGGHRSAAKTLSVILRLVYWDGIQEDVNKWVQECSICIRWRSKPRKQEARAVKTTALTCWSEIMVDLEGPNPADKNGYKYILTVMDCLGHGVLLEPVRTLRKEEVQRAFSRAILRSRTLPSVVRTDRGQEFTNALFQEFMALLGARQRLATPLRPCEMGRVERVHQEVQKMLGIMLNEVIRTDVSDWSEALCLVEFLIDTTPAAHGYAPRDLDRSWSIGLPLERELFRDVLEYEEVSDYARRLFKEFSQIRKIVSSHWDKASESRARLANKRRGALDLQVGDHVLYQDPRARPGGRVGVGRLPWKACLSGPWRVMKIQGNRVTLQLVAPAIAPGGTFSAPREILAHTEDLVLLPREIKEPDVREPIEFDAAGPDDGPRSVARLGEKAQAEFTITRRGQPYVLRLGDVVAYIAAGNGKLCKIGRVVSVTTADGSVTVHKYAAQTGGLRVKWVPVYLDEEGAEVLVHSPRPSLEILTIKRLITKVTVNADGILDAAGARRLDKGGYQLSETVYVTRVFPTIRSDSDRRWDSLKWADPEPAERSDVRPWVSEGRRVDFLEVFSGQAQLSAAVRRLNLEVAPSIDRKAMTYGVAWNLELKQDRQRLSWLICKCLLPKAVHLGTPCTGYCRLGQGNPSEEDEVLASFSCEVLEHQAGRGSYGSLENSVGSLLFKRKENTERHGELSNPKEGWYFVRSDGCQFNKVWPGKDVDLGKAVEKGQIWLSNFDLDLLSRRCRSPDAMFGVSHEHRHIRGSLKLETEDGHRWVSAGFWSGAYTPELAEAYARCLRKSLVAWKEKVPDEASPLEDAAQWKTGVLAASTPASAPSPPVAEVSLAAQ